MKSFLARPLTFLLASLAFTPVTRAALDGNSIPADARWMLHLDVDAMRDCPAGREIIALIEKNTDPSKIANIQIDFRKVLASLRSATAYGTSFSKNPGEIDGTLVLQGTAELRQIAEGLAAQFSVSHPEIVTELKGLPFPAYAIKNEVTIAFPAEPLILLSRSQPQLLRAYDLARGRAKASAQGASSLANMIPKNRALLAFAASEVPNTDLLFPENQPQARILKMARSASIAIGQDDKMTTIRLQLVAADDDLSDKLHKIVQGLVAMLSLAQSNDKQVAAFLQSVKTERDGRNIVVDLAYPTEALMAMARSIAESGRQRHNNHRQHPERGTPGKTIDSWTADRDTGADTIAPDTLFTRKIENVTLKNGTTIHLNGNRNNGENARYDSLDIIPAGGGFPLHIEAENMKLNRYRVEQTPCASGGRNIVLTSSPTGEAWIEFPGVDGTYTLEIRYVDENDGKAVFTVSTSDPEPTDSTQNAEPSQSSPPPPAKPVAPQVK